MKVECRYCEEVIELTNDEVEAGIQFIECYNCDAVIKTGLFVKG